MVYGGGDRAGSRDEVALRESNNTDTSFLQYRFGDDRHRQSVALRACRGRHYILYSLVRLSAALRQNMSFSVRANERELFPNAKNVSG